jgi:hypothetical protein
MLIGLWGCGDTPSAPEEQVGSIQVYGMLPDSTQAEHIGITLDDIDLGIFDNPHTVEDVQAGLHKLEVMTWDTIAPDEIEQYYSMTFVEVDPQQVSVAELSLTQEGPFVGNPAPDFSLYDLDSNLVSLSGLEGKVLLLYFFSNT